MRDHSWDVRMYICTFVSVMLGMSICTLRDSGITDMCITRGCRWRTELGKEGNDVSWQWKMGRTMWLGLHNVRIWQTQVQKVKKSVHASNSASIFNCSFVLLFGLLLN